MIKKILLTVGISILFLGVDYQPALTKEVLIDIITKVTLLN